MSQRMANEQPRSEMGVMQNNSNSARIEKPIPAKAIPGTHSGNNVAGLQIQYLAGVRWQGPQNPGYIGQPLLAQGAWPVMMHTAMIRPQFLLPMGPGTGTIPQQLHSYHSFMAAGRDLPILHRQADATVKAPLAQGSQAEMVSF